MTDTISDFKRMLLNKPKRKPIIHSETDTDSDTSELSETMEPTYDDIESLSLNTKEVSKSILEPSESVKKEQSIIRKRAPSESVKKEQSESVLEPSVSVKKEQSIIRKKEPSVNVRKEQSVNSSYSMKGMGEILQFYSELIAEVEENYEIKKEEYINEKRVYNKETDVKTSRKLKSKLILKKQELNHIRDKMTTLLDTLMNSIEHGNKDLRKNIKKLSDAIKKRMS
jgi:hypothetical protein